MDDRRTLQIPRKLACATIGVALAIGATCYGCGDDDGSSAVDCVVDFGQDSGPDFDAAVCDTTAPDPFHCPPGCVGEPVV